MRSREAAGFSSSRSGRSMTSLMRNSGLVGERQPRKRLQRVVDAHLRDNAIRKVRRDRIVAVELPVRIVGREQEHLFRADLVDDLLDASGVARRIKRLHGDAEILANDLSRLALD